MFFRLEMLYEVMTYFNLSYAPYDATTVLGIDGMSRNLKEEITRRHYLWQADSSIRSILIENKDFMSIITSNNHCVSFSSGR